ncbi:flagellar assembly protein FliH [Kaarinaea lacus]
MNTSKVIPKEKAQQIQRWQTPNVEQAVTPDSSNVSGSVGPLTAEAIERIQQQAYKEAYQEGMDKGYNEGMEKGMAEAQTNIDLFEQCLKKLAQPFEELDEQVEQQLASLAIIIARQIIRRELKLDPGEIIGTVREAILALPTAARKVHVYLHPDDVTLVHDKMVGSDKDSFWQFIEDPTLSRGDCRVITESSSIDATLERRLSSIATNLLGGEREQDSDTVTDSE